MNTPAISIGEEPLPEPALPETASDRVIAALHALQSAESQFRGRMRKRLDLGANELLAVQLISRCRLRGREVRPIDVTAALGVTSAATSIILTKLVERGFVTRHSNPADRRGQYLHLTTELQAAMTKAIGTSQVAVLNTLGGLSTRETARVILLLTAVTESYDAAARPDAALPPL